MVTALKGCAADRGHKYWLAIFTVYEIGLLPFAFLHPLEPAVSKTNRPTVHFLNIFIGSIKS